MSTRNRHDATVKRPLAGKDEPERDARVQSRDLLRAGRQLIIEHDGREYRLRLTSNGKLILTA